MYETFPFILLLILFVSSANFSKTNATTELNDIIQIPSEPTDFPGNNQDVLEILFAKATINNIDDVHVIGSIKNIGEDTLTYVDVTAHFFDENNEPIGITSCCFAEPEDIESGHTSTFDSFGNLQEMNGQPKYFRLSFEWSETGDKSQYPEIKVPGPNIDDPCNIITSDLKLTSNLNCSSDGLYIIDQDDLTIDLNGYTIEGPGIQNENAGIRLNNSSNILVTGPGTLKDFEFGILNDNGDGNKVSRVTFTDNEIGTFDVNSKNTIIVDNLMFGNSIGEATLSSNNLELSTNLFKSNHRAGVAMINTTDSIARMNTIQGSNTGVFLDSKSFDNTIYSNNILQNARVDVNNADGLPTETNDNSFSDNNCNTSVPDGLCLGR